MKQKLDEIRLSEMLPELYIRVFEEIDSTNTEARRMAERGEFKPALITAAYQSNGRGRQGKSFYSPKNTGLYMTLLYPVQADLFDAVRITAKTSVSVVKGLENNGLENLSIKWVNDIYYEDRKVSGILVESVTDEDNLRLRGLIIGIGINISTEDFPDEIKHTAGSLHIPEADINRIAADIIRELLYEVTHLQDLSYLKIYREKSNVIGKEIFFIRNDEKINGKAIGIDENGALLVTIEDGSTVTLDSGEITVRIRRS